MIVGTAALAVLGTALFLAAPGRAAGSVDTMDTNMAAALAPAPPLRTTVAMPGPYAAAPAQTGGGGAAPATGYPSGVNEVVKLFKGGITADIMVSYINNSPLSFYLSADNIISLQQQGVPGPVLTAMIHRYGELQRQPGMMGGAPAPMRAQVPAQAPAPTYYSYSQDQAAAASFNAALEARAAAAAAYAPPVGVYTPPVYYEPYEPFYYPWDYAWDPFFAPVGINIGVGYGRFGGFGHGVGLGRVGGFGRVGGGAGHTAGRGR